MGDPYDQDVADQQEEEETSNIRHVVDVASLKALLATDNPSPPLTVIVFIAPFCPHTKQMMIPALSELCADPEFATQVVFALCDVTESGEVGGMYDVSASPTIVVHFGNEKLYQYVGSNPAGLRQVVSRCLVMRSEAITERENAEAEAAAAAAAGAAAAAAGEEEGAAVAAAAS